MKPTILNVADTYGGAAKACYRIHRALIKRGVDSSLMVINKSSGDYSVFNVGSKFQKFLYVLKNFLATVFVQKLFKTSNPILHSLSFFNSPIVKDLNKSDCDIVNLHWVNNEMLSIEDISRIQKPLVWTLHDMWPFSGAEHYSTNFRWEEGYTILNRPDYESGYDFNLWTWRRKLKTWKKPIHIVTPSRWLADCVKRSALMKDWPVTVIPNAINTETWKPINKNTARTILNLPLEAPLLLFGAMGGAIDSRKGFDLLEQALKALKDKVPGLELVIFGQSAPKIPIDLSFPIHYTGHLHDDISLNLLYSAADALVIPSRQDNLPNTALEALASGTPIIAFNVGGLQDLICHKSNGYLVKAFDISDLTNGIEWMFSDKARLVAMSSQSRIEAVSKYSFDVTGAKYQLLFETILQSRTK